MIQLHSDYLVFKTASGAVPCSAEFVAIELMGDSAQLLDPEVLQHVTEGVLHHFRVELGKDSVSVDEFSSALARVLRGFGFEVTVAEMPEGLPTGAPEPTGPALVTESDLHRLASESGKSFELGFFPRLRTEVQERLREAPRMMRFTGLRSCVKQLAGARRWSGRCQRLNDQIVEFLRQCLSEEHPGGNCALLVV
ncbi:MAG: hypothetical protein H7A45_21680 [Verrucomicrobiales bacterium]|nr:hypothetical protein [Verrucomicrobiales bacterium]